MILLLLTFLASARADTHACSIRDIPIKRPRLAKYAAASGDLKEPRFLRTEENAELTPDNPTTYWAMPTDGSTVVVKVHRASMDPSAGSSGVVWIDTMLTIDPAAKTVSGTDECDAPHSITEHVLEILKVTQKPGAAN